MEKQRSETGTEERHLNGEHLAGASKVAIYQDRNENGCSEHGKHVLQTKQQHFRNTQNFGIPNDVFLLIHTKFLLYVKYIG